MRLMLFSIGKISCWLWQQLRLVSASQGAMKYQLLKAKVAHMNVQDRDKSNSVYLCSDSACTVVSSPQNVCLCEKLQSLVLKF